MTFVPLKDLQPSGSDGHPAPGRQTQVRERLPPWFKVRLQRGPDYQDIRSIMDRLQLHTICEEARCPNMWECWNARTATFLILGDICTQAVPLLFGHNRASFGSGSRGTPSSRPGGSGIEPETCRHYVGEP